MAIPIKYSLSLPLIILFIGCSPKYSKYIVPGEKSGTGLPDYSNIDHWAAHPDKKDPSDSVPAPLKNSIVKDTSVDVFFVHPTTYTNRSSRPWNASINNDTLNAKTDYTTILFQASVFNEFRVFAPRYRQANIRAFYSTDTSQVNKAFNLAYQDIKTAFQFYLENHNTTRPIIIAAHSQGTTHALRLLKEFFETSPLKNRLVVAYLLGMYIPAKQFSDLTMCTDSLQTGCFCGWRTVKKGYMPELVRKENASGLVTNPLSWTIKGDYAETRYHKGSVLRKFNKVYYGVADAQVYNGILWINKPKFPGSFLVLRKNYHIGDINLFYGNIRDNARTRVMQYKNNNQLASGSAPSTN